MKIALQRKHINLPRVLLKIQLQSNSKYLEHGIKERSQELNQIYH